MYSLNTGPKGPPRMRTILGALACGLSCLLVYVLWAPPSVVPIHPVRSDPLAKVAFVTRTVGDVRMKLNRDATWFQADIDSDLMLGDSLYSGRESKSTVRIASGGILEMGSNTLVVFSSGDGVTIPNLSHGEIRLKITGDMRVAISGEVMDFTGAQSELLINASESGTKIRSLQGRAALFRNGKKLRDVDPGQETTLPASPEFLKTVVPDAIPNVVDNRAPEPTEREPEITAEISVESHSETSVSIIETAQPTASEAAAPAPPVLRKIRRAIPVTHVVIMQPPAEARYKGEKAKLISAWRDVENAAYTVEIYDKNSVGKVRPMLSIKTKENEIEMPFANTGDFKIRVLVETRVEESRETASRPRLDIYRDFTAPALATYGKPQGLFPRDRQLLVAKTSDTLYFKWQRSKRFSLYAVQFSSGPEFKTIEREYLVSHFELKEDPKLAPGRWFWRVRGMSDLGESAWGNAREFRLVYD